MTAAPFVSCLFEGYRDGREVSVRLAGRPDTVDYVGPYLRSRFFDGDVQQVAGSSRADLELVPADRSSDQPSILVPSRIHLVADLRQIDDPVRELLSRNRRRAHLSRVRKHGYTFSITRDRTVFTDFYADTYLATMRARHGAHARVCDRQTGTELFLAGFLLLVHDGTGRTVAGIVCQVDEARKVVHSRLGGVTHGSRSLWVDGASQAADVFVYQWACSEGYLAVDLQGCEPFLRKGSLKNKVALGGELRVPATGMEYLRLSVADDSSAARDFLVKNPVISYEPETGAGVTFFDDGQMPSDHRSLMPRSGVNHVRVISLDDWLGKS